MLAALGRPRRVSLRMLGTSLSSCQETETHGDVLFEDFIFTSTQLRQLCACRAMLGFRLD